MRPSRLLWNALLSGDREHIARCVQQPHTHAPLLGNGARLVSEMRRKRCRATLLRVLRDAGLLVGVALTGAAAAIYVEPPLTRWLGCFVAAWFAALLVLTRLVVRRATGRNFVGMPEHVARYFADPEAFAFGWVNSVEAGCGFAIAAVLAALVARAW